MKLVFSAISVVSRRRLVSSSATDFFGVFGGEFSASGASPAFVVNDVTLSCLSRFTGSRVVGVVEVLGDAGVLLEKFDSSDSFRLLGVVWSGLPDWSVP